MRNVVGEGSILSPSAFVPLFPVCYASLTSKSLPVGLRFPLAEKAVQEVVLVFDVVQSVLFVEGVAVLSVVCMSVGLSLIRSRTISLLLCLS